MDNKLNKCLKTRKGLFGKKIAYYEHKWVYWVYDKQQPRECTKYRECLKCGNQQMLWGVNFNNVQNEDWRDTK